MELHNLPPIRFILLTFSGHNPGGAAVALLQGYNFIVLSAMNPTDQTIASATSQETSPTPLTTRLGDSVETVPHCGAMTPRVFHGIEGELDSLLHSAAVSDLGWRGKILVTGGDRLRWLNGMVSNAVQSLPEEQGNYSFLLSVQGRIQGDCYVYRRTGDLLLDTSLDQVPGLLSHLDHFIIMDDVELANVSGDWTGLSLAGPRAPQVLATLDCAPANPPDENRRMSKVMVGEVSCILVEAGRVADHVLVPRYELWFAPADVLAVWETLQAAGADPAGLAAMEALRVLEGTPLYGVDLNDRDLPQETAQTRALNFAKGCYLGQEIVERIRSRGKVNRQFRQFALHGTQPRTLPVELHSNGQPVGRITSTASPAGDGIPAPMALGFIRVEALERNQEITYEGGSVTSLSAPPAPTQAGIGTDVD
ncbi:MAG: folate-binding protein [Acidobacteriaceae bacterium]